MKHFIYILFLSVLMGASSWAQEASTVELYTSPKGVYVRLGYSYLEKKTLGESKYVVRRRKLTDDKAKTIGQMQLVKSFEQFQATLGIKEVQEFEKMNKFTSNEQTMAYLNSQPAYKEMALLGEIKIEFLQALGFAYLDANVAKNEMYEYSVFEQTNNGEKLVGEKRIFHTAKNFLLSQIKPELLKKTASDSSLIFQWKVTMASQSSIQQAQETAIRQIEGLAGGNTTVRTLSEETYRKAKNIYIEHQTALSIVPVSAFTTSFNVYYRYNDEVRWRFLEKRTTATDSMGNTILTARVQGKQDDIVETVLIPEDFVYNTGDTSKIARGVIAHSGNVELIYAVSAKDTTNAIVLNWKKLSEKPYYTGIEIAKSSAEMPKKVIQILPTTATNFVDDDVYPAGTLFTYYVRPLFIELQDIEQDIPAQVAISCAKFNRPTPPFNLTATPEGEFARLKWEVADEKAAHSFYIFRGTSPSTMVPIRSAVKERTYLDTTSYLTPRMTYYYSVMAVNVTQDTSAYAPYASYVPVKKEVVQAPTTIGYDIVNEEAVLNWTNVKLNDDYIVGYIVQRKRATDKTFTTLTSTFTRANSFTDTTFQAGVEYLYRIGTVVANGDTSSFSPEVNISMVKPNDELFGISDIKLVNLSRGIKVSWPAMETTTINNYKIYRKLPTELNFRLVGSVPSGNFEFEDSTARKGVIYTYTVRALNQNGVESEVVQKKTIMREVPK